MGALSTQELLRKATLTTTDFGGAGEAPLSVEQVDQFLRLAIKPQVMLSDVRTVKSKAAKWQESKIDFSSRILRAGVEGERLTADNRIKPTTGIVEISTVLVRGEVPITDEVMEDQVERAGFGDTVMAMVAEASGRDIEELFLKGDTDDSVVGHGETGYLRLLDGWIKQAKTGTGYNIYDATTASQDYQSIFKYLIKALPDQYKRDIANMRFYVPQRLEEEYRDQLSARGTPLGDLTLEGDKVLKYQSVQIKGVPMMPVASATPDTSFILLTHRQNLYAGFRREIKLETFRDPREGQTSFIVTARVDAKVAVVNATALAYNVNVEP